MGDGCLGTAAQGAVACAIFFNSARGIRKVASLPMVSVSLKTTHYEFSLLLSLLIMIMLSSSVYYPLFSVEH